MILWYSTTMNRWEESGYVINDTMRRKRKEENENKRITFRSLYRTQGKLIESKGVSTGNWVDEKWNDCFCQSIIRIYEQKGIEFDYSYWCNHVYWNRSDLFFVCQVQ